ncbi:hypothetical protein [Arthrobacter sp. KK5.5]|uniref:hypothetical protein n=1 Tax=Arthrobacter sp. KK5.5 TaxID=3373084 RepID=UPI003EE7A117
MENQTPSNENPTSEDSGVGLAGESNERSAPEWTGGHDVEKPSAESADPADVPDLEVDEESPAEPENS